MTLNSDYTYLFLDFETTGLDLQSEHPIQIALILVDHNFQILKTYNSYISLPDSVLSLKSNVSYMTGIDIDLITKEGKDRAVINDEIKEFFGEKTIIIGQNIGFDIGFLKKFFSDCTFYDSIDTYPLAASMIPYLKSYSLESIDRSLNDKFTSYSDRISYLLQSLSSEKVLSSHDALYDCIVGLSFIQWRTDQYESFAQEFPLIDQTSQKLSHNEFGIFDILTSEVSIKEGKQESLPPLISPLKQETKKNITTTIDWTKAPQHSKRSSKDIALQTMINELPHPCIIAVSHSSKIDIIKRACPQESFNYLKEEQILDQKKLSQRIGKSTWSEEEFLFIIFYLAHHRDGYRVLNPILNTHKYILDYLQDSKPQTETDKKILCSHGGLYYTMSQTEYRKKNFSDYPIVLLDADRRHTTYNDFAQKGMNLNNTLFQREKTRYAIKQEKSSNQQEAFEQLVQYRELFIGYFGMESERHLGVLHKLEIDYFADHRSYPKTNGIRQTIQEERKSYITTYEDIDHLTHLIEKIDHLLHNPLVVRRMVSNTKDISYTIAPSVRYIDFAEYLKLFGDQKLFFFSSVRSEYNYRLPAEKKEQKINVFEMDNITHIADKLKNLSGSTFIISHNSEKSKKLFQLLHEQNFSDTHKLIGEYLTGGVGKNTTLVSNSEQSISIGGYHMLLQLRAQGKSVDNIIILYIHQGIKPFIKADIAQYAPGK